MGQPNIIISLIISLRTYQPSSISLSATVSLSLYSLQFLTGSRSYRDRSCMSQLRRHAFYIDQQLRYSLSKTFTEAPTEEALAVATYQSVELTEGIILRDGDMVTYTIQNATSHGKTRHILENIYQKIKITDGKTTLINQAFRMASYGGIVIKC